MSEEQKKWFSAAMVRAARTVAQTAIASIGTAAVLSEVSWIEVLSASVLAGIISILMSVAGLPETKINYGGVRYVSEADDYGDEYLKKEVECAVDEGDGTSMIETEEGETDGTS